MQQEECMHPGCDLPVKSAGWCNAHYLRQKNGKDMDALIKSRNKGKVCSQDQCQKPARSKGLCSMHAQRLRHGRDMNAPAQQPAKGQKCKYKQCGLPVVGNGLCSAHYQRNAKGKDMDTPIQQPQKGRTCEQEGCNSPARAKGLCVLHYERLKDGVPMDAPLRETVRNEGTCSWSGCERDQAKKNLCEVHYKRQWAGREMDAPVPSLTTHDMNRERNVMESGYVEVRRQGHFGEPKRSHDWYYEHRYEMERHLERPLQDKETVHHINGIRNDNRMENLELWTSSQPAGQRVIDLLNWADEIIARYEPELDKFQANGPGPDIYPHYS